MGYLAQTNENNPIQFGKYTVVLGSEATYPDYNSIKQYLNTPNKKSLDQFKLKVKAYTRSSKKAVGGYNYYSRWFDSDYNGLTTYSGETKDAQANNFISIENKLTPEALKVAMNNTFTAAWKTANKATINNDLGLNTLDLNIYKDRICYDSDSGKYYKITVTESTQETTIDIGNTSYSSNATRALIKTAFESISGVSVIAGSSTSTFANVLQVSGRYSKQYLSFEETSVPNSYSIDLTNSQLTARLPEDAPYYTFALPYTEANYMLAIEMGTKLGSFCYDIQLLPYCPVQQWYNDTTVNLTGLTEHVDYDIVNQGSGESETIASYLFWVPRTTFTFDIPFTLTIEDYKIDNECNMYRLCSPNGNGEYEFSLAMNGGMSKFNVDCTYRPVNPYIHMNPDFNRLYGSDFNDFRGLICQGDFSIPAISNKWIEYEINNKNYQNIFNREISHQKVLNRYNNLIQGISATFSAIGAGATVGGLAGSALGPKALWGAGIGAGLVSAGGGIADLILAKKMQNENIKYSTDIYELNLQNIQALPNSIVKTGCKTNNNKLVPYLEYWTCTDTEKEAFKKKLYFEGMTIGAYGTVKEYLRGDYSFIQGELKRCLTIDDDTHLFNQIQLELNKGVYIK